jgi:hypothetical protein
MVRVAAQQLLDSVELPVGQPEGPVERLFGDGRQGSEFNRETRRRPMR